MLFPSGAGKTALQEGGGGLVELPERERKRGEGASFVAFISFLFYFFIYFGVAAALLELTLMASLPYIRIRGFYWCASARSCVYVCVPS